jgi:hypothetical protein
MTKKRIRRISAEKVVIIFAAIVEFFQSNMIKPAMGEINVSQS